MINKISINIFRLDLKIISIHQLCPFKILLHHAAFQDQQHLFTINQIEPSARRQVVRVPPPKSAIFKQPLF